MDFTFSEEQEAFRDVARRFAAEKLAPDFQQREKEGKIDRTLLKEMGALGLLGTDLPEKFGGLGQNSVTSGLITEAISAADLSVSYAQLLTSLNGSIVCNYARPEIAIELVPQLCRGEKMLALALTEPAGGSDAANLKLKARRSDKGYVLNGEKTSISMAAQSDYSLIFARTGTQEQGARGVSCFLVPLDAPGVSRTTFDDLGSIAVGRGSIFCDDVEVPAEYMVGDEGEGFRQVMKGFDYSRALIGLQVLAAAGQSLQETWQQVQERHAFGRPIAKYQGVTQPLAEADTMLTAATLLCYKTLWLRDNGMPHTAEAAMCKWWAPKLAFEIIHQCLLLHGHSGYSKDLPHQQRLRDVLGLQIGDGTAQIQKMIIARERIGNVAVPYV